MCNHPMPLVRLLNLPDSSRRWRITLLISRILTGLVAVAFTIMAITANRGYMLWFYGGMIVFLLLIPELTFEMLIRDFCRSGFCKISHRVRLLVSPVIYGGVYAVSPFLFHVFFDLFARRSLTMGGNTTSLQIGIWQTLCNPPSITRPGLYLIIAGVVFLIMTTLGICYLTTSKSWWKRLAAVTLLVLMEAAAAICACNSPG